MQSTAVSFVEADIPSSDAAAAAAAAAAAINSLRAHAVVHLDGHNGDSLIAAFALRPALLQVSRRHTLRRCTSPHVTRWCRRTTDSSPPQPRPSSPCTSPTPSSPPSSAPFPLSKSSADLLTHCRYASVLFTEKLILLPPSYLPNQVAALISSLLPCAHAPATSVVSCLARHRWRWPPPPSQLSFLAILIFVSGARLLRATASRPPPPCL